MALAKKLISLSKSDLKSSRLLYENRHFRTSYFFFQQSVEKANKAFGLLDEIITEDDVLKIQHNQIKIYRKGLIEQGKKVDKLSNVAKQLPDLGNHEFLQQIDFAEHSKYLKDGLGYIDSLYHLDLVEISLSDLNYLLRELRKFERAKTEIKIPKKIPKKADKALKQDMFKFADFIGNIGTEKAIEGKKELEELLNDEKKWAECFEIIKKTIPLQLDIMFVKITLWFCAIITVQHSSLTRYPTDKNNPIDIYKKKLPLVKKQPQFMDFLEKALIKLQYLAKLKN